MTERVLIEITERGARVVKRNIDEIGGASKKSATAVDYLKRTLGLLGGALLVRQLLSAADAFTELRNKIRVATGEAGNLEATLDRLFEIANRTRTPIAANAQLFQRMSLAAKELGATSEELFQVTENVAKALAIQGGSAESASGALLQLSQAMGAGIVRAEEFNSILEGAFPIAQAVARGLDRAGGSVAKLRQLIIAGEVTSQEFFQALLSQTEELTELFENTVPTVSQAVTVLRNNFVRFIGEADQATGVTRVLSQGILLLANNLDVAAAAALALSGALAVTFGQVFIAQLKRAALAVRALTLAIAANPIGAIAVALATVTTSVIAFRDEIVLSKEEGLTLGDAFLGAWDIISGGAETAGEAMRNIFGGAVDFVNEALSGLGITANDVLAAVLASINRMIGLMIAVPRTILNAFNNLRPAINDLMIQAMNAVVSAVETGINKVAEAISRVTEFAGLGSLGQVDLGAIANPFEGAADRFGDEQAKIFQDVFNRDFLGEAGDFVLDLARRGAELRKTVAEETATVEETAIPARQELATLTEKETTALENLLDQLDPIGAARREMAEAEKLLADALAAGVITADQHAAATQRLTEVYQDRLDPLGAVNRALAEERELLELSSRDREVQERFLETERALRDAGVRLTDAQAEALRDELTALRDLNEQRQREEQVLESIVGPQREYAANAQAIANLLADQAISAQQAADAQRDLRIAFLETQTDGMAGVERALLKMDKELQDTAAAAERFITQTFQNVEDALTQFISTGTLDFKGFIDSLIADLTRLAIQTSIMQPLSEWFSGVGGGTSDKVGKGGTSAGWINGNLIGDIVTGIGGLLGFAQGGSFTVGDANSMSLGGGFDNRLVAFRAHDGERVNVTPRGRGANGGAIHVVQNIYTQDADSFRKSRGQIAAQTQSVLSRAAQRNR